MELFGHACDALQSRTCIYPEMTTLTRSAFQRDCDRDHIAHSTAFRRLVHKTQGFSSHAGDLFWTQLTHWLEAAQLGRSIARNLQLNEDLIEAIVLAHVLGCAPLRHAGQDTTQY